MSEILIVGGGVAGLSAGIFARLAGHGATICEQQPGPGGNLTGWQRGAYHIDNCVHWLTGTHPATPTHRMWRDLGVLRGDDVYQAETLYTVEEGGTRLSLCRDLDRLEHELLALSPADAAETRALFRAVRALQAAEGVGPRGALLHAGLLPRYYRLTVAALAARFRHPAIRAFLRAFWGERFGALALLTVMADFSSGNGGLPVGGSASMAKRMQARFLSLGGTLALGCPVRSILHHGGQAEAALLAGGASRPADYFILTADPAVCFPRLLGLPLPKALARCYTDPRMPRFSSLQCAFACGTADPPFRGDWICRAPDGDGQLIVREFSHEAGFAPPGRTVLQTMRFCGEQASRDWIALRKSNRAAYLARKQAHAAQTQAALEQALPALRGLLRPLDVWTPATYRRYVGTEIGSYLGFCFPAGALPRKLPSRVPGLSNVLLATQWQQAPGGLPIAAERGKAAVAAVDRLSKKRASPARSAP